MKTCARCKAPKPRTEFWRLKSSRDGLHSHCKECHRESVRKSRKESAALGKP